MTAPEPQPLPPPEVQEVTDSEGHVWKRRYAPAWLWHSEEGNMNMRIEGIIANYGPITWEGM